MSRYVDQKQNVGNPRRADFYVVKYSRAACFEFHVEVEELRRCVFFFTGVHLVGVRICSSHLLAKVREQILAGDSDQLELTNWLYGGNERHCITGTAFLNRSGCSHSWLHRLDSTTVRSILKDRQRQYS